MIKVYKTIPCKGCGGPVRTTIKKPYCTHECRKKHNPSPAIQIDCQCVVCDKRIVRKQYKKAEQYCCSLECQRVWSMDLNKGRSSGNGVDWSARSARAKIAWRKKETAKRKAVSSSAKWWMRCKNEASKEASKEVGKELDAWVVRCRSASSLLTKRLNPSIRQPTECDRDWQSATKREQQKLTAKRIRNEQCEWTKKAAMISGCLRRRRSLLNAKLSM